MKKIDCHTHIINDTIRNAYFSRADHIALVMQFPETILSNPDTVRTVQSDPRLFLCPCIDRKAPIAPQLAQIEAHLDDWKVAGLKVYTSYQQGTAEDPEMEEVYAFAEANRLAVTFHTGLCSLVLPSDQDLEGSSALHIARAAERHPGVNFVAAHMDDPHTARCCRLCADHPNLFTDFSGLFEEGYECDWNVLLKQYGDAVSCISSTGSVTVRNPIASQILFGTDFCPPLNLVDIERFDRFLEELFSPQELQAIYYENPLRAFPRLADHLKEDR